MQTIVGVIGRAHGVRGEVAVDLRTDEPERRFAVGQVLRDEADRRPFTVKSARDHAGRLLVKFAELADRQAAEAVRGTLLVVEVEPGERPAEPEEFYDRQLVGLQARSPNGAAVGTILAVLHLPTQDVLEVETDGGLRLVPFVAALVPHVDLDDGYLIVAEVAGLLDDREDLT